MHHNLKKYILLQSFHVGLKYFYLNNNTTNNKVKTQRKLRIDLKVAYSLLTLNVRAVVILNNNINNNYKITRIVRAL